VHLLDNVWTATEYERTGNCGAIDFVDALGIKVRLSDQWSIATLKELKRIVHIFDFLLLHHHFLLFFAVPLFSFSPLFPPLCPLFVDQLLDVLTYIPLCHDELREFQPSHVLSGHHLLTELVLPEYLNVALNQKVTHLIISPIATQFDGLFDVRSASFVAVQVDALAWSQLLLNQRELFADFTTFVDEEACVETLAVNQTPFDRT